MSYVIDRRSRVAAAVGLVGGVLLLAHTAAQARSPAEVPEPLLAQAPGTPGPGAAPSPRPGAAPQVRQPAAPQPGSRDQDIQRQIDDLKKQMQITPNQEQQFNAFAEVMRSNAKAMDSTMQQQGQNPPKNAVDGLKAVERLAETQLDGLKRLVPAFQSLYDSLSDQQKKTADSIFGHSSQGGAQAPARPRG
jgi:protein CpxP